MDTLKLAPVLDLVAAAPLRSELLQRCGTPLGLDASEVQRLGGQCLQVLLSAQGAWAKSEAPLRIRAPSAAFTEALQIMGAQAAFAGCIEEDEN